MPWQFETIRDGGVEVASESKGCVLFVEVTNIQSFRYVEIQYKLEGFLVGYQS